MTQKERELLITVARASHIMCSQLIREIEAEAKEREHGRPVLPPRIPGTGCFPAPLNPTLVTQPEGWINRYGPQQDFRLSDIANIDGPGARLTCGNVVSTPLCGSCGVGAPQGPVPLPSPRTTQPDPIDQKAREIYKRVTQDDEREDYIADALRGVARECEAEVADLKQEREAVFDFAEKECGHPSVSSRPPLLAIADYVADLKRQLAAARNVLAESRKALCTMYDAWEDGTPCYEDVEEMSGSLGNAFTLSEDEENQILFCLELLGEDTALRKDKLTDEQRAALDAARAQKGGK